MIGMGHGEHTVLSEKVTVPNVHLPEKNGERYEVVRERPHSHNLCYSIWL